mmetsp:Transcript_17023/g.39853  ORF Transcript_17023/g.39853 Transcript_17023/m.39853 type:complete len:530 (+) Transcript_17023:330-1919(+)
MTRSIGNRSSRMARRKVSKKKIRFTEEGFDLDLTHITPRIIAMGYPSTGSEALYRNPASEVLDYFESAYAGHYKFYNLCSERVYDSATFHGRVAHIPFDDHNPPKMPQFQECCANIHAWLEADPENVVAIHCKAGKGRTGTIIAAYLVYAGIVKNAEEGLAFFGSKRTSNGKGVTIPSQKRFVKYFGKALKAQRAQARRDMRTAQWAGLESRRERELGVDVSPRPPPHLSRSLSAEAVPWYQAWFCFKVDEGARSTQEEIEPVLPLSSDFRDMEVSPVYSARTGWGSVAEEREQADDDEEDDDSASEASSDDEEGGWGTGGYEGGGDDHADDGTEQVVASKAIQRIDKKALGLIRAERARLAALQPSYPPLSFSDLVPLPCPRVIVGLTIVTTPRMSRLGGYSPSFSVVCGDVAYKSKEFMEPGRRIRRRAATRFELPVDGGSSEPGAGDGGRGIAVVNETRLDLYHTTTVRGKRKKFGSAWFHTSFVQGNELRLNKSDLDKICKDKKHKKFDQDIQVVVQFAPVADCP